MTIAPGEFQALHSDIKELKTTMQRVASETVLTSNRVGVLENRMNRYDSGARRLEETTQASESKLDTILLELTAAKADRAATIRTVKWFAGAAAFVFPALMWLIQHAGAK